MTLTYLSLEETNAESDLMQLVHEKDGIACNINHWRRYVGKWVCGKGGGQSEATRG